MSKKQQAIILLIYKASLHLLQLFLECSQLLDETAIGLCAGSLVPYLLKSLVETVFVFLHHVSYQDCC